MPIALEMIYEVTTGKNLFALLGGVPEESTIRSGTIRAQGPFGHSILAGTVGATSLPIAFLFYKNERRLALLGLISSGIIVFCCGSSGPILTAMAGLGAACFWKWRHYLRMVQILSVLAIVGLALVMKAPVYYIIARIDLTGSSTGWHRANLIERALRHLDEWWFAGTDYTRHWIAYGVPYSANHIDITNHYIKMGVLGGLPLMILFMGMCAFGFVYVGRVLRSTRSDSEAPDFLMWILGSMLFGHAIAMVGISYFDQSKTVLYLLLALIGSAYAAIMTNREKAC